jgi:transposase-like protein
MMLNIQNLIDEGKCFETVRQMRWPDGVICPRCTSPQVTQQGYDETQPARRKDECSACRRRFDDRTGTICAGHHRPWRTWILCLDLMGLKLANTQSAQELDLNGDDVQKMASQRREGIVGRQPEVTLSGAVECDEVDVTAGPKERKQNNFPIC